MLSCIFWLVICNFIKCLKWNIWWISIYKFCVKIFNDTGQKTITMVYVWQTNTISRRPLFLFVSFYHRWEDFLTVIWVGTVAFWQLSFLYLNPVVYLCRCQTENDPFLSVIFIKTYALHTELNLLTPACEKYLYGKVFLKSKQSAVYANMNYYYFTFKNDADVSNMHLVKGHFNMKLTSAFQIKIVPFSTDCFKNIGIYTIHVYTWG